LKKRISKSNKIIIDMKMLKKCETQVQHIWRLSEDLFSMIIKIHFFMTVKMPQKEISKEYKEYT
jgi:hypothetical protein